MSFQVFQSSHITSVVDEVMDKRMANTSHIPVMLRETLDGLVTNPDGQYLDATFGRGGHTRALLERLSSKARLWVLDRDPDAIIEANKLASQDKRVRVLHGSFSQLSDLLPIPVGRPFIDGALFDLGVSSPQLDQAERGFSFQSDGPLDMRMDNQQGLSATEWLSRADAEELRYVIATYGEDPHARQIAEKIVATRESAPITTTKDLVNIVLSVYSGGGHKRHPATRVFQAIRMHVNDELHEIAKGLPMIIERLRPKGRLATLSYHSLEHTLVARIVKQRSSSSNMTVELTPNLPQLKRLGRAMRASHLELQHNPRARSALLRIWEVANV